MAVDYVKTGVAAEFPRRLDPKTWPHFMEKNKHTYHSVTALGKLYDMVKREIFDMKENYQLPFLRWAEGNGFDLEYCSAVDLHTNPQLLDRYRLLVSCGHTTSTRQRVRRGAKGFLDNARQPRVCRHGLDERQGDGPSAKHLDRLGQQRVLRRRSDTRTLR